MRIGSGELVELSLENGMTGGRMLCSLGLIPAPGQYLLAHDPATDAPLPAPVFSSGLSAGSFLLAPPIPIDWKPGTVLSLRGPLGHGFTMPATARKVALVAVNGNPYRLLALLASALTQGAAVTLVSETIPDDLSSDVEIQPLCNLLDVAQWSDYLAFDVARESLPQVRERLMVDGQVGAWNEAQALVVTPMPCGGLAECGVCAVSHRRGWKMACKDGPVFNLNDLLKGKS